MNLSQLYPASFDGSMNSFKSFMRVILTKSSYDSTLKKITGFKGVFLNQQGNECWTLKFESFPGIFGLILGEAKEGVGKFYIYYFPSPEDSMIERHSLIEGAMAQESDYIKKVRSFPNFPMFLSHFYISTLTLSIDFLENSLIVLYETATRDRIYAKDGVKSPFNQDEFIIKPDELDKDLPSFRILLPFMNFFNSAITRLSNTPPSSFQIYKANKKSIIYDKFGNIEEKKDLIPLNLWLALSYGKENENGIETLLKPLTKGKNAQKIHEKMSLSSFFQKAPWLCTKHETFNYPLLKKDYLKPRLVVIAGFLGSGKTTLLQQYIEHETKKNRFIGIVQNEIGKVGLDGKLLDYNYSMVEMDEGCVCCSLSGQLRSGINTLMKKAVPDTILLETTGVANPFNLLQELNELDDLVDLEGIITVVDASNAMYASKEFTVFNNQIRAADVLLLNKIDLLDNEELEEVELFLKENNRCAKVLKTVGCDINPNLLLQSIGDTTAQMASLLLEDEDSPTNHIQDGISSVKINMQKPLKKSEFEEYLSMLPPNIYRVKGIVQFENEPTQSIVQYVHGEYEFLNQYSEQNSEAFLVYIGKKLEDLKPILNKL